MTSRGLQHSLCTSCNTHFVPALTLFFALLLAGCASSVETTFPQQWSAEVPVEEQTTMNVSQNGDYVFILHQKDVTVLDGTNGEVMWGEKEGLMDKVFSLSNVSVGGTRLNTSAPSYQQLYVDHARLALLFDYSATDDVIRAIDPRTGEERWERDDFQWSLAKYNSLFAQQIGSRIAAAIEGETDGTTSVDPLDLRFVRDLAVTLPDREVFIFKAVDGLVRLDLDSGEEMWRIPEFDGMGVGSVIELKDGDLVVVSKAGESIMSSFTGENDIARLDPEAGDLRWMATYSTGPGGTLARQTGQTHGTYVSGNTLVVNTIGRLQAYDLDTGEKLWHVDRKHATEPPLVTNNSVYATTYAGKAVQVGVPLALTRYDLRTGEAQWSTDDSKTRFVSMTRTGNHHLVAAVEGELLDGAGGLVAYDADTGQELWRSAPFAEKGLFSSSTPVTNLIVDGETAYVAGPAALHAFNVSDGAALFELTVEEAGVGTFDTVVDDGEQIIAIGRNGAAFVQKTDGTLLGAVPTEHDVTYHFTAGEHLFLEHDIALTAIDLARRQEIGVGGHKAPDALFGDLGTGAFVTVDGQHVFLLDGSTVHKHRIDR